MDIGEILLRNFVTLCLIVGLGIILISEKSLDKKTRKIFTIFIASIFLLCISDMMDYYLSNLSKLSFFRYATSSFSYTMRPAVTLLIINILYRRKKLSLFLWIPIGVLAVIAITSPFTHLMYWFTDSNSFMRGPIGFLPHILGGLYFLFLIASIFIMNKFISKGEIITIIYIAVICIAATLIESFTSSKFLLTGAMIVSCAIYYIFLYVQTYKRDFLTGIMNRRSFFNDTDSFSHDNYALISIDLNGLKTINDTLGHQKGDEALQGLADALMINRGKSFRVYRTGGDEFMAIGKSQNGEEAEHFIHNVKETLKKKNLMASFGYYMYTDGCNFDEVLAKADEKMYEDKKQYSHR